MILTTLCEENWFFILDHAVTEAVIQIWFWCFHTGTILNLWLLASSAWANIVSLWNHLPASGVIQISGSVVTKTTVVLPQTGFEFHQGYQGHCLSFWGFDFDALRPLSTIRAFFTTLLAMVSFCYFAQWPQIECPLPPPPKMRPGLTPAVFSLSPILHLYIFFWVSYLAMFPIVTFAPHTNATLWQMYFMEQEFFILPSLFTFEFVDSH